MTEERAPYYPAPREMTWEDLQSADGHPMYSVLVRGGTSGKNMIRDRTFTSSSPEDLIRMARGHCLMWEWTFDHIDKIIRMGGPPCAHKRRRILVGVQRHSANIKVPFARVTCADCGYEGKDLYDDLDIVGVV
jgi:hypothetical protein